MSHSGDRYHPDHFLCEYRGCSERLLEYYELDGRMLCERHVQKAMQDRDSDGSDYDDDTPLPAGDRHLNKRVTRFIDLGALNSVL